MSSPRASFMGFTTRLKLASWCSTLGELRLDEVERERDTLPNNVLHHGPPLLEGLKSMKDAGCPHVKVR